MNRLKLSKALVLLLFVYLIWVFGKGLLELYKSGGRLEEARIDLLEEQKKNEELKKKFDEVQDPIFIEKEAREKLNMQKPGETVVILPEINLQAGQDKEIVESERSNWEKWLELFK